MILSVESRGIWGYTPWTSSHATPSSLVHFIERCFLGFSTSARLVEGLDILPLDWLHLQHSMIQSWARASAVLCRAAPSTTLEKSQPLLWRVLFLSSDIFCMVHYVHCIGFSRFRSLSQASQRAFAIAEQHEQSWFHPTLPPQFAGSEQNRSLQTCSPHPHHVWFYRAFVEDIKCDIRYPRCFFALIWIGLNWSEHFW